jgi:hypothetical protein
LTVDNFDVWCNVTINGAPLSAAGVYSNLAAGAVIDLNATARTGFTWAYWKGTDGANAGNSEQDPNMSTTVTMTASKDVLACCNNPPTQVCPN